MDELIISSCLQFIRKLLKIVTTFIGIIIILLLLLRDMLRGWFAFRNPNQEVLINNLDMSFWSLTFSEQTLAIWIKSQRILRKGLVHKLRQADIPEELFNIFNVLIP